MSSTVVPFGRRAVRRRPEPAAPAPRVTPLAGSEVILCEAESGGYFVYDMPESGNSAGMHGYFADHAEAVEVGRRVAREIGGIFYDVTNGGAA